MDHQFSLADLRPGMSWHDIANNTLYYQGDGTGTAVPLPDGKTADAVTPALEYSLYERSGEWRFVIFNRAVSIGVTVTIALKER